MLALCVAASLYAILYFADRARRKYYIRKCNTARSAGSAAIAHHIKAVSCTKGGEERNEMNLKDKFTSLGPIPLVLKAVSCTKKRKGKK